ncbi:MAG: transcription-repair coupling factor [Gammaproteobacteria bacterium]
MSLHNPLQPPFPDPGTCVKWGQLYGASLSLAVHSLARANSTLTVVLTPDTPTATRLELELHFFNTTGDSLQILPFPDWETLPYDQFSPHQDIISQRLRTLYQLPQLQRGILLVPINTLMQRILPRQHLEANSLVIAKNEIVDLNEFRRRLENAGYRCVNQVMEHGEFAVRGAIIDLFPMGSPLPYRLEWLDNAIDSIRTFSPDNQRSLTTFDRISLLPAREFPLTEEGITRFRQNWRAQFTGNPANSLVYQNITQGQSIAGIEYYLPLFFEKTATLFDYLPAKSVLLQIGDLATKITAFWQEIHERYEQLRFDQTRPLLPPSELFLSTEDLSAHITHFTRIETQTEPLPPKPQHYNFATDTLPEFTLARLSDQPLARLQNFLATTQSRVLFCAETLGRRESLLELLKNAGIHPKSCNDWSAFLADNNPCSITIGALLEGLVLQQPSITLIAEPQLFGEQVMQRRLRQKTRQQDPEALIRNLTELTMGAPIVHLDHGVGRYLGLQTIKTGEQEAEYLTLEYAGNAKLYVPVSSLHLISRYTGADAEHAPLNHLSSKQWEKAKQKAAEKIRDVAAELLEVYARRQAQTGHIFTLPKQEYQSFVSTFPYEETPDQAQAIEDVIRDMVSPQPMDRLVCGDVGFGKTEVAMRAAFVATQNNKQVAVLVPTTLLAEQHYQTFKDRFADWPIRIAVISRLHSSKDQQQVLQDAINGKIDILIGTHKLLHANARFKTLGLLVVDEEHRFGVHQKEKIKALRAEVDILTLTATPIPRTLNMALISMRDLSLIATPPLRRLSIKTFVREYNRGLIREAILRETLRGGQVYFLHNDIDSMEKIARELKELVPEARIEIAHGQMPERILSKTMSDFYHTRFNVLICTTIIESGIDIPTANTIIINRADRFGLAQLHQLRGRVGRSHHQAYAYLLIPDKHLITHDALKRLEAIEQLEDLGVGFLLATQDLEIRGAGELLGEEQSGHIQAIGFSLYTELLEKTVRALKSGKAFSIDEPFAQQTEIDLQIPALIPENYVGDVHVRLTLYKRIANAKNEQELNELQVEMIDRFGLLPEPVKNLFRVTELRLQAAPLGIRKIDIGAKYGRIEFSPHPNINIQHLIKLIQIYPNQYKLDATQRLQFHLTDTKVETKISATINALNAVQIK